MYYYEKGNYDEMRTELGHIDCDMEFQKRAKDIDIHCISSRRKLRK